MKKMGFKNLFALSILTCLLAGCERYEDPTKQLSKVKTKKIENNNSNITYSDPKYSDGRCVAVLDAMERNGKRLNQSQINYYTKFEPFMKEASNKINNCLSGKNQTDENTIYCINQLFNERDSKFLLEMIDESIKLKNDFYKTLPSSPNFPYWLIVYSAKCPPDITR